jgi:hypothetical protein
MQNTTVDDIIKQAEQGEDIEKYFKGGSMKPPRTAANSPIRVNVDFTGEMLKELDHLAANLNISRQAVIKSLLQQALNNHYTAQAHKASLESA